MAIRATLSNLCPSTHRRKFVPSPSPPAAPPPTLLQWPSLEETPLRRRPGGAALRMAVLRPLQLASSRAGSGLPLETTEPRRRRRRSGRKTGRARMSKVPGQRSWRRRRRLASSLTGLRRPMASSSPLWSWRLSKVQSLRFFRSLLLFGL